MPVKGTLAKFTYGNQIYRLANDVDVDRKPKFNIEPIASSGDPDFLYENQVEIAEGFPLLVNGKQRKALLDKINTAEPADCTYKTRAGDVYTAECVLNVTADGTREGKITVDAMPTSEAGWTPTLV